MYLNMNHLLSDCQHGFRSKRSTTTQLIDCYSDWMLSVTSKQQVAVIHLDYARAFDSVVFSKLVFKFKKNGNKRAFIALDQWFFV